MRWFFIFILGYCFNNIMLFEGIVFKKRKEWFLLLVGFCFYYYLVRGFKGIF